MLDPRYTHLGRKQGPFRVLLLNVSIRRTAVLSERIFNTQHLCHERVYKDEIVTHKQIHGIDNRDQGHTSNYQQAS